MSGTTIGYSRSVNQGMMFDERTIRPAVVEDASAIAQVHVESWKTTYKGIFPAGDPNFDPRASGGAELSTL